MSPFITVGNARFLNVPHAAEVLGEIVAQDCYRLDSIPDGSIVMDVGAFYGEFGLVCYRNKDCFVSAYEPAKVNYDILNFNAALNYCRPGYQSHHAAIVGSNRTSVRLCYRSNHPAGSALLYHADGIMEDVAACNISQAIKWARTFYGHNKPVVVKMDCEGEELDIFLSDSEWIQMANIVTMEWHNYDGDAYAQLLEREGFTVELEGGGPKPRPKWDKSIGAGLLFATRKS